MHLTLIRSAPAILLVLTLALACAPAQTTNSSATQVTLTGKVIQKPWRKSYESWNAGGSEYYVLDVGSAQVQDRTAREGVILLPPDGMERSLFQTYTGKNVSVRGYYHPGKEYEPNPMEQYPSPGPGQKLMRGSGFKVLTINPLN